MIKNTINGDLYIGKSINIKRRWRKHRNAYKNKNLKCYDYYLYRAMRKYGIENFEFIVLEECDEISLIEREQYYVDLYKPKYNMINPKQDVVYNNIVKENHIQSCKKAWVNRSEVSKEKALNNLKLGVGGRLDKVKVLAINIETCEEIVFNSVREASAKLNIPASSISQIMNPSHIRKQSKGYVFKKI